MSAERAIYVRQLVRILAGMVIVLFGSLLASAATADSTRPTADSTPPTYEDVSTSEGWAWSQIKQGLPADFGERCGVLDARAQNDLWWRNDSCRTIQASFIVDLLTKGSLHESIPHKGIVLINAKIVGDVDLEFATIDRPLGIQFSRFEGAMHLDYARADSPVDFAGSLFLLSANALRANALSAIAFRSESNLDLTRAIIRGKMDLSGAKIKGDLVVNGANFADELDASELDVGGSLLMLPAGANKASFKNVTLRYATVAGPVNMSLASLDGDLDAEGLRVGSSLLMNKASLHDVNLLNAEAGNNVELVGATVIGVIRASGLKVGGSRHMQSEGRNEATFKEIYLPGAKITRDFYLFGARVDSLFAESVQIGGSLITASIPPFEAIYRSRFKDVDLGLSTVNGQVNMPYSIFDGNVTLNHLHVIGDVLLSNIESKGQLDISSAQISGDLDFRGAKLDAVDLGGAFIAGVMRLGDEHSKVTWTAPEYGELNLRGTHVARLSDGKESWPKLLFLESFSFDHFGEKDGNSGAEMIGRGADWWITHFVEHDSEHGASPYQQLAVVFAAASDHDDADEIQYDERVWADQKKSGLAFVGSSLLRWGAGYSIGSYLFRRALLWTLILSIVGALFLRFWANRGIVELKFKNGWGSVRCFLWCFGASVNRLLPVLSLKKEFVDFFDDPKLNQFTPRQDLFFVVFALVGWVLGFIVIAAFATITHGP